MKVLLLPGDGIGPEVTSAARRSLETAATAWGLELSLEEALIGGAALDTQGVPLPPATRKQALAADAVLLGAVGGPAWDGVEAERRPERGLLELRAALGVFGNLRPVRIFPPLLPSSALREANAASLDLLIVRELIGGIYFGTPRGIATSDGQRRGVNTMVYHEHEIRRIARLAFSLARQRRGQLCSVDKANVLEVTALWRQVVEETAAEYPQVELRHLYVDNAAMQLVLAPGQFDVLLSGNLFGDILSDLGGALSGSLGMLPSASLNDSGAGLYEPCHGSAPPLAGQDRANPLGAILSAAMLLRHSLHQEEAALALEQAVARVLEQGLRTEDIHTPGCTLVGTTAMGLAVCSALEEQK